MNNIVLTTSWSEAYTPLAELSWHQNKVQYAHKHGYGTVPIIHSNSCPADETRIRGVWEWMQMLPEGHWLVYSACDVIITRPEIKLEKFIPEDGVDFICCMSYAYVFGDIWMVRNCAATRKMFDYMFSLRPWRGVLDQLLFPAILSGEPFEVFARKVPHNILDESFYVTCEKLMSATDVRVKCIRPHEKFAGDNPALWPGPIPMWEHPGPGCNGQCPPELTWSSEHFMMHVGGKSLDFRMQYIREFINGMK